MALTWSKELSSDIVEIDLQHKRILDLLNILVVANEPPVDKEKLANALDEFTQAIEEHFKYEEALLVESGYKNLKRHQAGHAEIYETLQSIMMSVMFDESDISSEMIKRVVRWFEEHLKSEDPKYFRFVNKSTVKN